MTDYDVFNGDADGICALLQLRRSEPRDARLVTGVKRDIALLGRVREVATGDRITVLDVSLDKNRSDLQRLVDAGAAVFYCDHHYAGDIPQAPNLDAHINTAPDVCTSLLVNGRLQGAGLGWAVVGAFGDNLSDSARRAAAPLGCDEAQLEQLRDLGIYLNYNGYGAEVADLHFDPADLFRILSNFEDPFRFLSEGRETFEALESGYRDDMSRAQAVPEAYRDDCAAVYILPAETWARRVSGVFGNALANACADRAHAILTATVSGDYVVSVRAPLSNKTGADELCRRYPTGGGRGAAAGINALPQDQVDAFIADFSEFYRP